MLSKSWTRLDVLFFLFFFLSVNVLLFLLFHQQAVGSAVVGGPYPSDMKAYLLEMQGMESGYRFPYPVFFQITAFFHLFLNPELAITCSTLLLNAASMVLLKLALEHFSGEAFRKILGNYGFLAGPFLSLAAFSLLWVSMVYPPPGHYLPGIENLYLGVFTPNPFHNATYLATRPFAIIAFFWYAKLMPVYEKGCGRVPTRDYVVFGLSLLLTTMTKPSFTLALVGAAGVLMGYRLIRSGLRNLIPTLQLTACFLPTFAHLLYQYQGVFVPQGGEEGGIGFGLATAWKLYCGNIPLAVGLAMGFPLLVLFLNFRELKTDMVYRLSWQVYAMSLAMLLFCYEKGFRLDDLNFSWGYMHGIFFAFLGALLVLLRETADCIRLAGGKEGPVSGERTGLPGRKEASWKIKVSRLVLQWLAYGWHLACGLAYFFRIFQGSVYR